MGRRRRAALRLLDALFERAGVRPITALIFAASLLGLLALELRSAGQIRARAVATAPTVEHTARVASVVQEVHVRPGQLVEAGAPLLTLSARGVDRGLDRLEAELNRIEKAAILAQARALVDNRDRRHDLGRRLAAQSRSRDAARAEVRHARTLLDAGRAELDALSKRVTAQRARASDLRDLTLRVAELEADFDRARARSRAEGELLDVLQQHLEAHPERSPLEQATLEHSQAELAALRVQRDALLADQRALTLRASSRGRVAQIAALGSAVDVGAPLASILPFTAEELVVYVSPETPPAAITPGAAVHFREPRQGCSSGEARVLRVGAAVQRAPEQLLGLLREPVHGLPVYVSIPAECELAVGQLLDVELALASP